MRASRPWELVVQIEETVTGHGHGTYTDVPKVKSHLRGTEECIGLLAKHGHDKTVYTHEFFSSTG